MIEDIISFMQPSIKSPIIHQTSDVNGLLYADINQINQVLNNLIINASQASINAETIMVNVSICHIETLKNSNLAPGSYIAISVKDKGVGMSEECQQSIFKPYFTTKEKGGIGSTFTVYLPISTLNSKNTINQSFSDEVNRGSGNILYIEDDLNTQVSMLEMLESIGYHVKTFASLTPAVQYINNNPDSFDLVLTDYMLGDHESAGEVILNNVHNVRPDCSVILVTGYFEQLKINKQTDVKFSYIVQKPVGIAQISQIINRFC